jgi:hypothetical protein
MSLRNCMMSEDGTLLTATLARFIDLNAARRRRRSRRAQPGSQQSRALERPAILRRPCLGSLYTRRWTALPSVGHRRGKLLRRELSTVRDSFLLPFTGASCFNGGAEASMLIFLAIMLHKGRAVSFSYALAFLTCRTFVNPTTLHCNLPAPAAFGFSVYLTQHGCKARDTRRQLLLFSLAAPVSRG